MSPRAQPVVKGVALVARYTLFAALATVANLAAQRAVLAGYGSADGPWVLALAIGAGTAVGLVVKYLLDKRWIFGDRGNGLGHHGRTFGLYTAMGLATTAIFWGMETGFWLIWRTDTMREAGALIGLAIGYVTKYRLDRAYVFAPRATAGPQTGRA